ncbi:MAG TPA: nuclear transport factor 2 family protein [Thermomicrobiales bacterium]|nr:nuclear transport factor 2 family protein [Thermomicrobiales bacterium]
MDCSIETASSPRAVLGRALDRVRAYDLDGFADLFVEDGVVEYPFAPAGALRRLEGREEIRRVLGEAAASPRRAGRRVTRVNALVVHQTVDSEVIVAEFDLEGEIVATGQTYRLPYIQVLRVRDGRIVSLRDYIDYPALAALTGGVPEPLAAAAAGSD